MSSYRSIMETALLVFAGMILRDLQVWAIAKFFCWLKRRQTQRQGQAERLQRQKEADDRAARIASRNTAETNALVRRVRTSPFVIEPINENQVVLAFREITCALRSEDRRRFLASLHSGNEEVN
jgi:hypothetical protein